MVRVVREKRQFSEEKRRLSGEAALLLEERHALR
jgi:hypothetical protein